MGDTPNCDFFVIFTPVAVVPVLSGISRIYLNIPMQGIGGQGKMPVTIDGQTYYRTAEVFRIIGVSRNTLYRWLRKDTIAGVEHRDSRGWRLFTRDEIDELDTAINRVTSIDRRSARGTGAGRG
jgi:hypothetical protein